jgi:hypothetical protein
MSKRIGDFVQFKPEFLLYFKGKGDYYTNTTPQKHGKTVSSTFVSTKVYEYTRVYLFETLYIDPLERYNAV